MFKFLNKLFNEGGFIKVAFEEIQILTSSDGPFQWIYENDEQTVYGYWAYASGDQSLDPQYDMYKDSKIIVYENPK